MSPIDTAGLFRATINALRENSNLLLSTMHVFIKELLMKWMLSISDFFHEFVFY